MTNFKLDQKNCLDIILTDIQLHSQKKRNPNPLGRQVSKAMHGSKVNRAYSNSITTKNKNINLSINLGMEYFYNLARKEGKKYIRFFIKKNGLPVKIGKDAIEKLIANSKKYLKKK